MPYLVLGPCDELHDSRVVSVPVDTETKNYFLGQKGISEHPLLQYDERGLNWDQYTLDLGIIEATMDRFLQQMLDALKGRPQSPQQLRTLKILMGHTVWRLISICRREYNMASQIVERGAGYSLKLFDWAAYDRSPATLADLQNNFLTNKVWTTLIRQRALEVCFTDFVEDHVKQRTTIVQAVSAAATNQARKISLLQRVSLHLSRRARHVIYKSYLPRAHNFKIQSRLGQVPVNPPVIDVPHVVTDHRLRSDLLQALQPSGAWERFAFETVLQCLPRSLLDLDPATDLNMSGWPVAPRTVFTSNAFDGDEGFLHWVCYQIDHHKTKYIVGQHGHPYSDLTLGHTLVEQTTSDVFVPWGTTAVPYDGHSGFCFTKTGTETEVNPDGKISLILRPAFSEFFGFDSTAEFMAYTDKIRVLFDHIPSDQRADWLIKPHSSRRSLTQPLLDTATAKHFAITPSDQSYVDVANASRLLVFGYMSSGVVHAYFCDQPLCVFLEHGLAYFEPAARPIYQALIDAGIAFDDPQALATHVTQIQGSVQEWWQLPAVRNGWDVFAKAYAVRSSNPVGKMVHLIRNQS